MVKFLEEIKRLKNLSNYGLAKIIGIPTQSIDHALDKGQSLALATLARLRYLSGLTWSQFGKLIDMEYLPPEDRRRIDTTTVHSRKRRR